MIDISFDSLFGDQEVEIDCSACGQTFQVPFKKVAEDGATVICPSCKTDIIIEHDDTTKKTLKDSSSELKQFNKSMKDLEKAMKKLGK